MILSIHLLTQLSRNIKDRISSIKKRVKVKLMAYFAFYQRSSRGHPLSSLKIENCNLRLSSHSLSCFSPLRSSVNTPHRCLLKWSRIIIISQTYSSLKIHHCSLLPPLVMKYLLWYKRHLSGVLLLPFLSWRLLISKFYSRILEVRNCGVDDNTAKILSQVCFYSTVVQLTASIFSSRD